MEAFEILLQENHLNLPEQQNGLERLKTGQAKLEADYMQAKEEHNMKARMGSGAGQRATFDPERSVEGQIFQLGMKLEDIQETVQVGIWIYSQTWIKFSLWTKITKIHHM